MPETLGTISYRVQRLEKDLENLDDRTQEFPVVRSQINRVGDDVKALGEKVDSLRRATLGAALSLGGGAIILAISIQQVFG